MPKLCLLKNIKYPIMEELIKSLEKIVLDTKRTNEIIRKQIEFISKKESIKNFDLRELNKDLLHK